ncbi:MAG: AIM24 family protein [Gemmataceae bacterium]|nr:AIM24 family protein [Gemmataceae bacterium]
MAKFRIEQSEGMRWVHVTLDHDAVRTRRGALSYMQGAITLDVPLPSLRGVWVSLLSNESFFRPRFRGTGQLNLESSLGGYHVLKLKSGEDWILDQNAFWCADDSISLSVYREWMITAFWAGEGLIWYKTRASGEGTAVIAAPGPVEEVTLKDETFVVDGSHVLARTHGLSFSIRRPSRGILGFFLSGERTAHVYKGSGKLLLSATPYWRYRMMQDRAADSAADVV